VGILTPKSIAEYPGSFYFNRLKNTKELVKLVKTGESLFVGDLNSLMLKYREQYPDSKDVVLVKFAKNDEVVGGVASTEKPIDSYIRRIRELREAAVKLFSESN
jgi:uncharacterized radical SAM superfamily protein